MLARTRKLGFGCLHSGIRILRMLLQSICMVFLLGRCAGGTVIVTTSSNTSLPFVDAEAGFTPRLPQAGIVGLLYLSNPVNACEPLHSGPIREKSPFSTFVLIQRGGCKFEDKVRNAQEAGFSAAIVFNDAITPDLFTMSGNSFGIEIPAVFVTRAAGLILAEYAGDPETRCYIFPTMDYPAWSVMAVAFISLVAVTAVLATFFFVRRHRLRRLLQRESPGLSASEVKALPTFVFAPGNADQYPSMETCVICMEDYEAGQKLRLLPCRHAFHVTCVDQWLLTRKPFCPVCKRDAHAKAEGPSMTETTPLLTAARVPIVSSSTQTSPPAPSRSFASAPNSSCSPIAVPLLGPSAGSGLHRSSSLDNTTHVPRSERSSNATASSWPRSHADDLC